MPGRSIRPVAHLAASGLRGRRRSGLAVTVGVLLLSAFGLCAGFIALGRGNARVDQLAQRTNVADVVAWAHPGGAAGSAGTLPGIAAFGGVTAAAGPLPTTDTQINRGSDPVDLQVTGLDDPRVPVNHPLLDAGRWVAGPNEIVLERSLAAKLGLRPGSTVGLRGRDGTVTYTVAGTAFDLTDCTYPQCDQGRSFATGAGVRRLGPPAKATYWLRVSGSPERVADQLLAHYGRALEGVNTWPDTRHDLTTVNDIFGRFVSVFGAFLLVACAIVVAGSMGTRMIERRREIGLYGAVGATRRQVVLALIAEEATLGVAASVVAWALAGRVTPFLAPNGSPLGRVDPQWPVGDLVLTAVVVTGVLVVSIVVGAWRTGRRPVPELLCDAPPVGTRSPRSFSAHVPARLSLVGVNAALARPVRAGLTALAVVVAVVGAIVATGFVSTMGQAINQPVRTGDPWTVSVNPRSASEARVESVLRSDRDVAGWYTETDRPASYRDQTFRSRAIGGSPRYELGAGRMPAGPGEVIVGYGMVKDFGMSVGTTATVRVDGKPFTGHVVGWYRETEDSGDIVALRLADLRRLDPTAVPDDYQITTAPGVTTDHALAGLRSRLGPTADVSPFDSGSTGGLGAFRVAIALVAVFVGVVALANLMAALLAANAENARATGIGQALGFTPRQVVGQGAVAAAATGLAAAVVGVPLGLVVYRALSNLVTAGIGAGPGFAPMPGGVTVAVIALGAAVLCGLLGAEAGRRAARRPITTALRWE